MQKKRQAWLPLRSGDRIICDECQNNKEALCHIERYKFASKYVKNKTVLDAGCGIGYGSKIAKENGAALVIGIDCSKEAIDYARKKNNADNLFFYSSDLCGKLECLANANIGQFDVAICLEVIEHVLHPEALIKNLDRLVKKNGLIILSTPNKLTDENMPCHEKEFTIEELRSFIGRSIEISECKLYGQRNFPHEQKEQVVYEIRKEIDMHYSANVKLGLKNRIKKWPLLRLLYPCYSKIKAKLFPMSKGILDVLSCEIKPVFKDQIPITQILILQK